MPKEPEGEVIETVQDEGQGTVSSTTHRATTELLDQEGKEVQLTGTPLSDIFDRMASGIPRDEAVKQTQEKPKPKKEAKKEEEKKPEETEPDSEDKEDATETPEDDNQEDDAESALSKRLGEQVAKKEEEKKAAEEDKKPEPPEDDVAEEDMKVLPYDKPKTAKRIQALLKRIETVSTSETTTKKQLEERDAKLKTLEEELGKVNSVNPETNEEIKTQLEELSMLRRRYELDNDPEVKEKFDARIENSETTISSILEKKGAGKELLAIINEEGGWLKFSESTRTIPLADGTEVTAAELVESIKKGLPLTERRQVEGLELEQVSKRREKELFLADEAKKADAYFKSKAESQTKAQADQQAAIEANKKLIEKWQQDTFEKEAWLKEKPVPPDAAPETKAAIENDNKYTKQLQSLVRKSLNAKDLNEMLDIVLDSARFYDERRRTLALDTKVKSLEKQIADKQAEIDKFKKASSTTPRPGSLSARNQTPSDSSEDTPADITSAFDRVADKKASQY